MINRYAVQHSQSFGYNTDRCRNFGGIMHGIVNRRVKLKVSIALIFEITFSHHFICRTYKFIQLI